MKHNARYLSRGALIAALYAVLCIFLQPLSYSSIQLRLSEVLCVLPIFMPEAVFGLFVGCFVANILGGSSAVLLDMVLGSLTTLVAAILTRKIYRKTKKFSLALLPPVILNAVVVGTYIPFLYTDPSEIISLPLILASNLSIAISEAIVIYVLGLPLCKALDKTGIFNS